MEPVAEIESRLNSCQQILDDISKLERRATNSRVKWELSTIATRVQNGMIFLRTQRPDEITSSNGVREVPAHPLGARGTEERGPRVVAHRPARQLRGGAGEPVGRDRARRGAKVRHVGSFEALRTRMRASASGDGWRGRR